MEEERNAGPSRSSCARPLRPPRRGGLLGATLRGAPQGCWVRAGERVGAMLCSQRARPFPCRLCG
eukprot:12464447-Alexandrium_andersonii.AAC.1